MKSRRTRRLIAPVLTVATVVFALVGALPYRAVAGGATDTLRPAIDTVISILADPALKGADRTAQRRAALYAVVERIVDFPEAAQRALALHWRDRTAAEREEFVRLFKDLVTYSYILKMEPYAGQQIVFAGETVDEGIATVMTRVQQRQGAAVPIDYRMHQRKGSWLVYDVVIEGVRLVANYRTQFNTIVRTSSYAELVRRLNVRVAELTATPPAPRALGPRPPGAERAEVTS